MAFAGKVSTAAILVLTIASEHWVATLIYWIRARNTKGMYTPGVLGYAPSCGPKWQ